MPRRSDGGRPRGVTALAVFFALGAAISSTSCLSILTPGGPLEPMWRLNPRARTAFERMGQGSIALLGTVCVACATAAAGLWRGRKWGYWTAVALLLVNLAGDLANAVTGVEPRALFGVPIVAGLLAFLARPRVRGYFADGVADPVARAR